MHQASGVESGRTCARISDGILDGSDLEDLRRCERNDWQELSAHIRNGVPCPIRSVAEIKRLACVLECCEAERGIRRQLGRRDHEHQGVLSHHPPRRRWGIATLDGERPSVGRAEHERVLAICTYPVATGATARVRVVARVSVIEGGDVEERPVGGIERDRSFDRHRDHHDLACRHDPGVLGAVRDGDVALATREVAVVERVVDLLLRHRRSGATHLDDIGRATLAPRRLPVGMLSLGTGAADVEERERRVGRSAPAERQPGHDLHEVLQETERLGIGIDELLERLTEGGSRGLRGSRRGGRHAGR